MMINWGQELKDIFTSELKQHAELTAIEKMQQFQEKYNTVADALTQGMYLKENDKGMMDAYVKLDDKSKAALAEKKIVIGYDGHYIDTLNRFWKEESLATRKEVKNPYAKIMLHNYAKKSLLEETKGWERAKESLLQEQGVQKIEALTRSVERNNTVEQYGQNYANLTGSINNSYLSPLIKSKLIFDVKNRLADSLLQRLSVENPDELIRLHKSNHNHQIFTDSLPRVLSHSLHNAKRNSRTMHAVNTRILEASLGQNLEMIKDYGVVQNEYFEKLFSLYESSGKKWKEVKVKALEEKLKYAQQFYYTKQQIEQIPLAEREEYLMNLVPTPEKAESYAIDKRVYEEIKNETLAQKRSYETDPAGAADRSLLEIANPINKMSGIKHHEKRYMDQISKGLESPKILTNIERENIAQVLATTNNSDEIHVFLEMKEKEYQDYFPHLVKEVMQSKKIDIFLNNALEHYNTGNIGLMEHILSVRAKVKDGILKEENFSDKESVQTLKELVYTDSSLVKSLPFTRHKETKYLVYEIAKDLFKNSNEKGSVKDTMKNAKELFFSNLHTEEEIYVPKIVMGIKGKEEITSKEAKDINFVLSEHLNNRDYWNEEHLSGIFGKFTGDTPSIKNNQLRLARDYVKRGRWVLTDDLSGYVFEMQAGNKLYYDTDESHNLKHFSVAELLSPTLKFK